MNAMYGASTLYSNNPPQSRREMLNGGCSTYDYYETLDKRYLSVGALEPQFAKVFFQTIGHPEWMTRASDISASSQKQLSKDIGQVLRSKTLAEWESIFSGKDCCVEPVLTLKEAISHPRTKERGLLVDVSHGRGYLRYLNSYSSFLCKHLKSWTLLIIN